MTTLRFWHPATREFSADAIIVYLSAGMILGWIACQIGEFIN